MGGGTRVLCARITPEEPLVREHCLAGTALVPGWHMFCFFVCAPRIDRLPAILAERTASSPRCGASVRKYRYGGRMATLFLVAARPHCRPPPLEKARLATGLFFFTRLLRGERGESGLAANRPSTHPTLPNAWTLGGAPPLTPYQWVA